MNNMISVLNRLDSIDALSDAVALRGRGYELLSLEPGASIVDVGCGGGRAAHELAERGARASGVDVSQDMIAAARERWSDAEFQVAPAEKLPFADASLDGYRADKVYHALEDPAAAIREARRVLRPGGRAMLVGHDWDLIAIDADDHDLTRRLLRARAAQMPSPNIARGHGNLLRDNGFTDVTVEVHTVLPPSEVVLAMLTDAAERNPEAAALLAEQRERAASGRLFMAMPVFLAAGTR